MSIHDLGNPALAVERVLKVFPHELLKIQPGETLVIVARYYERTRAAIALVVDEGEHLCGVVSLGDIVRSVGELGAGALYLPVRMIMSANVFTCEPRDLVTDALQKMIDYQIKHLPVVEDGKLVGLIERIDALQVLCEETSIDLPQLRNYIFKTGSRY